jgi:hypothetical protein
LDSLPFEKTANHTGRKYHCDKDGAHGYCAKCADEALEHKKLKEKEKRRAEGKHPEPKSERTRKYAPHCPQRKCPSMDRFQPTPFDVKTNRQKGIGT